MSIGERIKELRKGILKLNQSDFAAPLGLNQSTIGGYENGLRSVSDATILAICREYGANEEWLRTGKGEPLVSIPATCISELASEFDLDLTDQNLIMEYLRLDKQSRAVLKNYIKRVFLASEEGYSESDPFSGVPKTPEELEKQCPPINIDEDAG